MEKSTINHSRFRSLWQEEIEDESENNVNRKVVFVDTSMAATVRPLVYALRLTENRYMRGFQDKFKNIQIRNINSFCYFVDYVIMKNSTCNLVLCMNPKIVSRLGKVIFSTYHSYD